VQWFTAKRKRMRSIGNRRQDITRLSHQVTPVLNDPQIDCILLKRRPPCVLLGPPCCLVCLPLLRYCRLLGAVVAIRTEPPTTTAWEHFRRCKNLRVKSDIRLKFS
jgi:hypothetical protein